MGVMAGGQNNVQHEIEPRSAAEQGQARATRGKGESLRVSPRLRHRDVPGREHMHEPVVRSQHQLAPR